MTHDTRKALIQTTEGQIALCKHSFTIGFEYVLLRDIQSDRIEGEFSVYRQSTGANAFMVAADVLSSFKNRLARYAASFLESVANDSEPQASTSHECVGVAYKDATDIEACIGDITLTETEEYAYAYV